MIERGQPPAEEPAADLLPRDAPEDGARPPKDAKTFSFSFSFGKKPPADLPPGGLDDAPATVVPGHTRTLRWTWGGAKKPAEQQDPFDATYYERFTGQPDPMRDFFVTSRRILSLITWAIAIGLPVTLVVLGIARGESQQTIFYMAFFGLLIGVMLKATVR